MCSTSECSLLSSIPPPLSGPCASRTLLSSGGWHLMPCTTIPLSGAQCSQTRHLPPHMGRRDEGPRPSHPRMWGGAGVFGWQNPSFSRSAEVGARTVLCPVTK